MNTRPLLIEYQAVSGRYEWSCRRCGAFGRTLWLLEAENAGFDHVGRCRGRS